jgi:radical SAM superfamily enzyme
MILGLPGETREEILEGAVIMGQQPLHSIKLHQLQIIKGTAMAAEYIAKPETFRFWSLEEYIELVIDYLEVLNPEIVVERFAGEVPPRYLVGPGWGHVRNDQILVMTEKRMGERNTWQGKKYGGSSIAPA